MVVFPVRTELANLVSVQRQHEPDPRQHGRPAALNGQHQLRDRGLPLGRRGFLLGQVGDVGGGVVQRDERATVRQFGRIVKFAPQPCSGPRTRKSPGGERAGCWRRGNQRELADLCAVISQDLGKVWPCFASCRFSPLVRSASFRIEHLLIS